MVDSDETPTIIDKRTSAGASKVKYGEFDSDPVNTARGSTRLSQVRWPLGEEPYPDAEGTDPDDGWVNVHMDVTEHPDPDPNQMDLLHGGPELKLACFHCGEPLHAAATKDAKEILEEAGYRFPEGFEFPQNRNIVACVCINAHIVQVREDIIGPLIK